MKLQLIPILNIPRNNTIKGSSMEEKTYAFYRQLAQFDIDGRPPRKSNQRQLVTRGRGGKPMFIKSKAAREYMSNFSEKTPVKFKQKWGSLKDDLRVDIHVWYPDRRSDLSIELILDCLEKAEVIKNDRYIREQHVYGHVDKENPRISITLFQKLKIKHEV